MKYKKYRTVSVHSKEYWGKQLKKEGQSPEFYEYCKMMYDQSLPAVIQYYQRSKELQDIYRRDANDQQ